MTTDIMDLDPARDRFREYVNTLSDKDRAALTQFSKPRIVEPYIRHIPHPAQQVFLSMNHIKEVMYGGSAGSGKSDALLMAALQYVDVPGYSALILRRTWPDLNAPGAILDRARNWLEPTPAQEREGGRIFRFPSGAVLQFGYTQYDKDKYKFQSAEYQFIGFDELTQFEESLYTYLHSRTRRPSVSCLNCNTSVKRYRRANGKAFWAHTREDARRDCPNLWPDPKVRQQYPPAADGMTIFDVPIRVRSATNPGGIGHEWVKTRFIKDETRKPGSMFVPARFTDNPSIDQSEYLESLEHLLPVDRERLLRGDWDVENEGEYFTRHHFIPIGEPPAEVVQRVRYWDLAATIGPDSDWTCGALVSLTADGQWTIEDIVRFKGRPLEVERTIRQTAGADGIGVPIYIEQEPGSAGVNTIDHYRRNVLVGFRFDGVRSTGSKEERAMVVSSAVQAENVNIVDGPWNRQFLDEAAMFPNGAHDDQVDACSGAFAAIAFGPRTRLIV